MTVGRAEQEGEQECTVLPNMGQECHRRPGTPEEEAARAVRIAELRTRLTSYVEQNSAALYRAVVGLYPFSDPTCAVPYSETP